jgi:hypothetical protein
MLHAIGYLSIVTGFALRICPFWPPISTPKLNAGTSQLPLHLPALHVLSIYDLGFRQLHQRTKLGAVRNLPYYLYL